ncbi:unnamed protein product [Soboliphyme baturini]|uniref:Uncharacterized protein n=1 Tax=Soboliphyme baturini TaxID=241478 RepID=A0A183J126_9BILA|nr:unnamed protein product [Soboliphyme baturini]
MCVRAISGGKKRQPNLGGREDQATGDLSLNAQLRPTARHAEAKYTMWSSALIILIPLLAVYVNAACPTFSNWTSWTDECLWYPLRNMYSKIADTCGIPSMRNLSTVVPTPPGFVIPERCGHCSFKFRCRNRTKTESCL